MSFRDAHAMIECVFYVNELPGGEGQHDGGMKGRDAAAVLSNPMLQLTPAEQTALQNLQKQPRRDRRHRGAARAGHAEPSARARGREGHRPAADRQMGVTRAPDPKRPTRRWRRNIRTSCFFVSCDLNPSTKLGKAAGLVPATHRFEMSIEEQASTLMADGLSMTGNDPQLNVFATFAAFMEGIAREGFEMWRYQRNLDRCQRRPQRRDALVARRRQHRPRSLFRLEPGLGQPGDRISAVSPAVLRAGGRARRLPRRARCLRGVRRPHRGDSARQPAGADAPGFAGAAVGRGRCLDADHAVSPSG